MKREAEIKSVVQKFSKKLGVHLAGQVGRGRLLDVATDIVDYKEQVGWSNTPSEIRRLTDKIRYIPARMNLGLDAARLSKKSETEVHVALWRMLKRVFPTLELKPTN